MHEERADRALVDGGAERRSRCVTLAPNAPAENVLNPRERANARRVTDGALDDSASALARTQPHPGRSSARPPTAPWWRPRTSGLTCCFRGAQSQGEHRFQMETSARFHGVEGAGEVLGPGGSGSRRRRETVADRGVRRDREGARGVVWASARGSPGADQPPWESDKVGDLCTALSLDVSQCCVSRRAATRSLTTTLF